jgi:hypothetical protein
MLPGQPAVISNSAWSRIRSDSKSRIRSSRGNSLHSSRGKNPPKNPTKPKPVATKAAVAKTSPPETAPVKTHGVKAATETGRHALRQFQRRPRERGQSLQWLLPLTTCGSCDPPFHIRHPIHYRIPGMYKGRRAGPPRQKEISGCWNTLPSPPVWNLIGQLPAMPLVMAIRISRSNQNWGSHTEFTVAQAGIKGVARRSLSAWRQARRPASNGDPLQRVYRPALTLAST